MPSISAPSGWRSRKGRKVIVVVTDGGDTGSKVDVHKALEAAQLADAVIYAIVVMPITNDAGRNIGGEHALEFMAKGTGGRTFMPSRRRGTRQGLHRHHHGTAHPVPAGVLSAECPPDQRPLPQTGGARPAPGFAGIGAQRLLWGSRGWRRRRFPGGPHLRFPGQAAEAVKKEALGESLRHLPENPRARRNKRLKRRSTSNS